MSLAISGGALAVSLYSCATQQQPSAPVTALAPPQGATRQRPVPTVRKPPVGKMAGGLHRGGSSRKGFQEERKYRIIAGPAPELGELAQRLVAAAPARFSYYPSTWEKFPDGSDRIQIGGFVSGDNNKNKICGGHVMFLASFHNNDVTLSQFYALTMLCESLPASVTVLLPFYPTATMERVTNDGEVATANTLAQMFSNLPIVGPPTRVIVYDLRVSPKQPTLSLT